MKRFRNVWDGKGLHECIDCGGRVNSLAEMETHKCTVQVGVDWATGHSEQVNMIYNATTGEWERAESATPESPPTFSLPDPNDIGGEG